MKYSLSGIYPPLVTTFENDELSLEKLLRNVRKYERRDLSGYVLFGSNGESAFLTRYEKIEIISSVREQTKKMLIVGTGSDSIKDTIQLTNDVAEKGADFALIITPSFFKSEMKHHTFMNYYTKVAESVMIPIIVYNVPKFTAVNIETETIIELSRHPNIIGLKESSDVVSKISEIAANVHQGFKIIVGTASVLYPGLLSGATGGILALANLLPDECIQLYQFVKENKIQEALELQNKLIPINKSVTNKFGVAGLKAAMDLLGYDGGHPRMPLEPLNEAQLIELKIVLKSASFLE